MTVTVLVPIADGTEEIEAVTLIDVLRRADADVTVASVNELQVTASRGVNLVADCLINACQGRQYDLVVLPGGMPGATHLKESLILKTLLIEQHAAGRWYGAICAAPAVVLESHGLLQDRKATCHPGHVDGLGNRSAVDAPVVVDGNCVTSRGPGTALQFALTLVEMLYGKEKRDAVAGPMVISDSIKY